LEEPQLQPPRDRSPAPERLKRRADFLNAAKGKRFHAKGFVLQAARRREREPVVAAAAPRVGFTVTKKIGGAALRNRIRRRLKEAMRTLASLPWRPSHDYVILARPEAAGMPFLALQAEVVRAVGKIEAGDKSGKPRQGHRQESGQDSPLQRRASDGPLVEFGRDVYEAGRERR